MKQKAIFGIDPGTTTGIAIWHVNRQRFETVLSCNIIKAFEIIDNSFSFNVEKEIWFEDARQRKWFGKAGREQLQGAGSIKRDCAIWEEFCKDRGLQYRAIAPRHIKTKLNAQQFKTITGWMGKTNEHQRDAAMICFQAN